MTDTPPETPIDIETVLAENASARAEFMAAIDALPRERREEAAFDGWSVHDLVLHLAIWQDAAASVLLQLALASVRASRASPATTSTTGTRGGWRPREASAGSSRSRGCAPLAKLSRRQFAPPPRLFPTTGSSRLRQRVGSSSATALSTTATTANRSSPGGETTASNATTVETTKLRGGPSDRSHSPRRSGPAGR